MGMRNVVSFMALVGFGLAMVLGIGLWYCGAHQIAVNPSLMQVILWLWPSVRMAGSDAFGVACQFGACLMILLLLPAINAGTWAL